MNLIDTWVLSPAKIKTYWFLSKTLIKKNRKYTNTEKYIKEFQGILFGYKINVFSDHKDLVYAAAKSEHQRVIHWWLILKEFGTTIQHIYVVEIIVSEMISGPPSTKVDWDDTSISWSLSQVNKLFTTREEQNLDDRFPLDIVIVQQEKTTTTK